GSRAARARSPAARAATGAATARAPRSPGSPAGGAASWRRGVAVAPRHEELHRQLGADPPLAGDLERALAHRGELVAHAAVVVVIGDLVRSFAAGDAPTADLGELADIVPAHQSFSHRLHQLGLVVDFQLLAQVDDDHICPPRALVVELALRIEARRRLDADEVRAGPEPLAEEDRLGGIAR